MIVGENVGLECKTASPYSVDKWKNGKAPAHYILQCHYYMAVSGATAWYLAVLSMEAEGK
ncbi:MAG: YqaJ viral recombinase family protein, partial [Acetivibrio ethanolgignens]